MKTTNLSWAVHALNQEVEQYLGGNQSVSPVCIGRPRIGITMNPTEYGSSLAKAYSDTIIEAGGIPMLLPITECKESLLQSLQSVDGLLLTGGGDINPIYLGEEPIRGLGAVSPQRDRYELTIIRLARSLNLPTLGICRGHQLLGVAYGSTLFQDIVSQYTVENAIDHAPKIPMSEGAHRLIEVPIRSRLADILQIDDGEEIYVNSLHHQALQEVRPPFDECGIASDGINEAIDAYPEMDILAVQWHPEQMVAQGGDHRQLRLFVDLVERAGYYKRARHFHQQYITLDSHTDTPMFFSPKFDIGAYGNTLVDLPKLELGQIDATIMVAYLPQGELSIEAHRDARTFTETKLAELHRQVSLYPDRMCIATCAKDIKDAKRSGKRAIIPAIENGYAIGEDISLLRYYKEQYGIVYVTLCHNGDNALCDSARKSLQTHDGLSATGKEAVREMNRLGIMIDLSHAGEKTVSDVLELTIQPVIASHSSARSLCDHARNLTDEQIRAIARTGGVVQICLYAGFINEEEYKASYLDAVDHIEHIIRIAGIEHVGIGSDFDGDGELIGCRSSQDLIRITIELLRRGYDEEDLALIWGGNLMRVMQQCQSMSTETIQVDE